MTSEEINQQADMDAKEFFLWLDGYLSGMSARDATCSDIYRIDERITALRYRWENMSENRAAPTVSDNQ